MTGVSPIPRSMFPRNTYIHMDEPAAFSQAEGKKLDLECELKLHEMLTILFYYLSIFHPLLLWMYWCGTISNPENIWGLNLLAEYLFWSLNQVCHLLQSCCGWTDRAGCSLCCWHLCCETHWSHIYTCKTSRIITEVTQSSVGFIILQHSTEARQFNKGRTCHKM